MCMMFRQINIAHNWTFVLFDKFGHKSVDITIIWFTSIILAPLFFASENIYISLEKSIELVLSFFMVSCFTSCSITVFLQGEYVIKISTSYDAGKADTIFLVLSI